MAQNWEQVMTRAIQGRLNSLGIRLQDLAKNLTNLSTDQLDSHCTAIMEDLSSFSYGCMVQNVDRLGKSEFMKRFGENETSMRFCVSEELSNIDRNKDHKPEMTTEKRKDMLMHLKDYIPFAGWCHHPYDAHELFMKLAKNFKDLIVDELKHRAHGHAMTSLQPGEEEQGFREQSLPDTLPREGSIAGYVPEKVSEEAPVSSQQEIQSIVDGSSWWGTGLWVRHQIESYKKYLQLPVTDDVVSMALQRYDGAGHLRLPFSPGMSLLTLSRGGSRSMAESVHPSAEEEPCRYSDFTIEILTITRTQLGSDFEFVGDAFKKEVPVTHPSLTNLDVDFEKIIPPELGIVIAWKFTGGDAWKDRYGHIVPK